MRCHSRTWVIQSVVAVFFVACGPPLPEETDETISTTVVAQGVDTNKADFPQCLSSQPYSEYCGDGLCTSGEDTSCPQDCPWCGDGVCAYPEDYSSCPSDCSVASYCGDGVCNGTEATTTCPQDCGTRCGDNVCNGAETAAGCEIDCGLPQDAPFQEAILQDGGSWQLKNIQGTAWDLKTGRTTPVNTSVYVLEPTGILEAPLSESIREELLPDASNQDTVITLHKETMDEIEISRAQGYLTPSLQAIAETEDGSPATVSQMADAPGPIGMLRGCSDRFETRSKSVTINTPVNQSINLGGGFSGTVTATGNIQSSASGEIQVRVKRTRVVFWCIPYGVRLDYARAAGNATVDYNSNVTGTINYANSWTWPVRKLDLFSLNFSIGPIPVHIGFKMPITWGLDLQASASGSLTYKGAQRASGSFNYSCTLDGCTGSSNFTQTNPVSPQVTTADVSGRIKPTVWVQMAVRGYLYDESIAYAQIGVRPYLRGDLWGYYGNNCGDADRDGLFETVRALTFDLDLQVYVTAETRLLWNNPRQWNDLWHTPQYHLAFWNLVDSTALSPMLGGSSTATLGAPQSYTAKMRPCYPYSDTVAYELAWGDGTSSSLKGSPQTEVAASHTWSTGGTRTLTLLAQRDTHGRTFNRSTSRNVTVTGGTWTIWLDRDDPSGVGDYEDLVNFGSQVCSNPIAIQCQTTAGVDWTQTGERYTCTPSVGGVCVNSDQPDGQCMDYRVRFLCP